MEKKSLTQQYLLFFDRLPPLLQTMDYESKFYQDLMFDAIINEKPITEEDIEKALEKQKVVYDTADEFELKNDKRFNKFKKGE